MPSSLSTGPSNVALNLASSLAGIPTRTVGSVADAAGAAASRPHRGLPAVQLDDGAFDFGADSRFKYVPVLGLTELSNYLTLKGSFSSVSKPNFASKYAL